jgi:Glycosyltransferase family 87
MMPGPHTPSRPGAREMTSSHAARALGVAALGAIVLFLILFSPAARNLLPYPSALHSAARTLKGASAPSDLAADIIGLRAMARQEDAYPILGPAAKALGLQWPVNHVSTHPPTACLLVAPVAFLPWPLAAMLWAWMMLALLAFSFRLHGLPWLLALGLTPIALLWPPVATSLGQLTIIWLWGFALGFRNRQHNHFLAGIGLGLAALTKLVPGLMIILFLSKKRWHAFRGSRWWEPCHWLALSCCPRLPSPSMSKRIARTQVPCFCERTTHLCWERAIVGVPRGEYSSSSCFWRWCVGQIARRPLTRRRRFQRHGFGCC